MDTNNVLIQTFYMNTLTINSNIITNSTCNSSAESNSEISMITINIGDLQENITISENQFINLQLDYIGTSSQPLNFISLLVSLSGDASQILFQQNLIQNASISSDNNAMTAFISLQVSNADLYLLQNTFLQVDMDNTDNFLDLEALSITVATLTVEEIQSDTIASFMGMTSAIITLTDVNITNMSFPNSQYSAALYFLGIGDTSVITVENLIISAVSTDNGGIVYIDQGGYNISFSSINLINNSAAAPIFTLNQCGIGTLIIQSFFVYTSVTDQSSYIIELSNTYPLTNQSVEVQNITLIQDSGSNPILFLANNVVNTSFSGNTILTLDPSQLMNSSYLYQYSGNVVITENFQNLILGGQSWITLDCDSDGDDLSTSLINMVSDNITITNSFASFIQLNGSSGSCALQLDITNSTFSNFDMLSGDGSTINVLSSSSSSVNIVGSIFEGNKADNGGAIYFSSTNDSSSLTLDSSNFTNNYARFKGGAIYATSDYITTSNDCHFTSNQAYISGACFYIGIMVNPASQLTSGATLTGNTVSLSQQIDIGTNPSYFSITMNQADLAIYQSNLSLLSNGTLFIHGVAGYSMQSVRMTFSPFDCLDQPYYDYQPSDSIVFTIVYPTQNSTVASYNCTPTQCFLSSNSLIYFSDVGSILLTTVTYSLSNGILLTNGFYVQIRDCVVGEIIDPDLKICVMCPKGKFSLNTSDTFCTDCPTGAECPGGDQIIPLPGYYRSTENPDLVLICWNSTDSCLGGALNNCSHGYSGPLCQQCENDLGYVNMYNGKCDKCSSQILAILITIGSFCGNFLFQSWIVYGTWKDNKKKVREKTERKERSEEEEEEDSGPFQRQLNTYFQIISIVGITAPSVFDNLSGLKLFSNPLSGTSFYMDCIFQNAGFEAEQIFRIRIYTLIFTPFVKIALFALFIVVLWLLKKKSFSFIHVMIVDTLVVLTGDQPAILNGLVSYLNCIPLDTTVSTTYIATYLNVECDTYNYKTFLKVVYPLLVSFAIIMPLILLGILIIKREALHQPKYRLTLGTIYNDFRKHAFYWGIVLMCFKISLVVITQALNVDLISTSALVMLVILIYAVIFLRKNPYYSNSVALCEKVSIVSLNLGVVWGILLQQSSSFSLTLVYTICAYITTAGATLFILYFISKITLHTIKRIICKRKKEDDHEAQKESKSLMNISNDISITQELNSQPKSDFLHDKLKIDLEPNKDLEKNGKHQVRKSKRAIPRNDKIINISNDGHFEQEQSHQSEQTLVLKKSGTEIELNKPTTIRRKTTFQKNRHSHLEDDQLYPNSRTTRSPTLKNSSDSNQISLMEQSLRVPNMQKVIDSPFIGNFFLGDHERPGSNRNTNQLSEPTLEEHHLKPPERIRRRVTNPHKQDLLRQTSKIIADNSLVAKNLN